MESTPRILLIREVATLLRVANVTIYRWLAESREGRGHFPLPVSQRGGKLRWLATDIEAFLQSQSTAVPPVNVTSATKRRQEAKEYRNRQERATAALRRHGFNGRNCNHDI